MVKIILGFIVGVLYGAAIYTVDVPNGVIAKAAAILKMVFFG